MYEKLFVRSHSNIQYTVYVGKTISANTISFTCEKCFSVPAFYKTSKVKKKIWDKIFFTLGPNCLLYFSEFSAGGVCGRWHWDTFHTGRPQLLCEGCEQREETRRDHSHSDCGRHRDCWVRRMTACLPLQWCHYRDLVCVWPHGMAMAIHWMIYYPWISTVKVILWLI